MSTHEYPTPILIVIPKTGKITPEATHVTLYYTVNNEKTPTSLANLDGSITSEILATKIDAKMHIRGKSTRGANKPQYSVHLNDNPDDPCFLGMPEGGKHWVFNDAGFVDHSLIRDVLAFEAQRSVTVDPGLYQQPQLPVPPTLAHWAPRTKYFEMFLCPAGTDLTEAGAVNTVVGHYQGVYINMEKIRIQSSRINIEVDTPEYMPIVMQQNPGDDDHYTFRMGVPQMSTMQLYVPKIDDITAQQWDTINDWFYKGNTGWGRNFQYLYDHDTSVWQEVEKTTDFFSFALDFLLFELSRDQDGYTTSTYYYRDGNGVVHGGPMWDKNLAFGQPNSAFAKPEDWLIQVPGRGAWWWHALLTNKAYCQQVWNLWTSNTGAGGPLAAATLTGFVQDQANYLKSTGAVARDIGEWHHFTQQNFDDAVEALKTYLTQRIAWMSDNLAALLESNSEFTPS